MENRQVDCMGRGMINNETDSIQGWGREETGGLAPFIPPWREKYELTDRYRLVGWWGRGRGTGSHGV